MNSLSIQVDGMLTMPGRGKSKFMRKLFGKRAKIVHLASPIDLPMTGRLTRESKKRDMLGRHTYTLTLKFKPSRRHYTDEVIYAVSKKAAIKYVNRMYPNARIK